MKKMVAVLGVALALAACEQGPGTQESEHAIVGSWQLIEQRWTVDGETPETQPERGQHWWTFRADGVFVYQRILDGEPCCRSLTTYIVDEVEERVYLVGVLQVGETAVLDYTISGDRMVLSGSATDNHGRYVKGSMTFERGTIPE